MWWLEINTCRVETLQKAGGRSSLEKTNLFGKQGNRRNDFYQTINIQLGGLKRCCADSSVMSAKCYWAKKRRKHQHATGPKNIAENTGDIILSFPSKIINKVSMPSACACLFSTNRNLTIFISPLMHTILLFNIWCRITEGNVSKLLFIGLLSYCMIKPLNIWLLRH